MAQENHEQLYIASKLQWHPMPTSDSCLSAHILCTNDALNKMQHYAFLENAPL